MSEEEIICDECGNVLEFDKEKGEYICFVCGKKYTLEEIIIEEEDYESEMIQEEDEPEDYE
jgi:uncharacterized Zn finger protein (UPF0148 family)